MLHIAQLISSLRQEGGAEKVQVTFARAARQFDIKMTFMTLFENDPVIQEEIESFGARVIRFKGDKLYNLFRLRHMVRFIKQEKIDIIHAHLSGPNILGPLMGWMTDVPVVTTLYNTKTNNQSRLVHGPIELWLTRHRVQEIIAVGWETAAAHQHLFEKPIIAIPNAVAPGIQLTPTERQALRVELMGSDTPQLLMSVGRLTEQKAFPDLLVAFAKLLEIREDVRLVIIGTGHLEDELQTQIRQLNLSDKVKMLGLRRDVPRLLPAADIYVSSSHWEGLPVATLEAMVAGLPIVATDVGDVARIVVEGTGLVVPPRQPKELTAALATMLENPDQIRTYGQAAQAYVSANFGEDEWARQIVEVYKTVALQHQQRKAV